MAESSSTPRRVNLALQGGGAQGAFTWGVLDRLLGDPSLEIEGISATSAGAMNAVVALYGFITGGREKAAELLHEFWHKVSLAASISPLQPSFFDRIMGQANLSYSPSFMALDYMTRIFSPYQLNLFDINPLRAIIGDMVDFEAIRAHTQIQLFINATHVKTGKSKVFSGRELTLDMVMASCCLPFIFKAVEVDGEYYWDGSFSGNPAIAPLIHGTKCQDVVLVQVTPLRAQNLPVRANEIMDHITEISFNAALSGEMRAINFTNRLLAEGKISGEDYKMMHIHMIEAQDIMASLDATSKLNANWTFLTYLRDAGTQSADEWREKHFDAIGERSSIDVRAVFL